MHLLKYIAWLIHIHYKKENKQQSHLGELFVSQMKYSSLL